MISEVIIKYMVLCIVFFAILSISGRLIEKQEKRECKEYRHRYDKNLQQTTNEIEYLYISLCMKNIELGKDKPNSICQQCRFYENKICSSSVLPDTFLDDTGAMADCSCYQKRAKK